MLAAEETREEALPLLTAGRVEGVPAAPTSGSGSPADGSSGCSSGWTPLAAGISISGWAWGSTGGPTTASGSSGSVSAEVESDGGSSSRGASVAATPRSRSRSKSPRIAADISSLWLCSFTRRV